MRRIARACWLSLAALAAGCTQNPYLLQRQITALEQQQTTLAQQSKELQTRAAALDKDNQDLEMLLAQEQQRRQLLADQEAALREQLASATGQITRLKQDYTESERRALNASTRRPIGATIEANNSLLETLPVLDLADVQVRRDGDVIRIELPSDRLFVDNSAQLRAGAGQLLDSAAAEISRTYPDQFIGIEGHTDNAAPPQGATGAYQLAVARASAVHDYLAGRTRLRLQQLFIAGHGPNHPVVSNGTTAGKARNRRIELVIYPEQAGRR
jgi:flagellar motor protein MotB